MKRSWKRDSALFLVSQTISLLGSSLVQYALMWYVTLETQSGIMMMVFIICGFVPTFLLSPFAGVWADRHDRKKLIMLADAMIALVTLVLALVFTSGTKMLWLFFLAAAIRSIGTAIQGPAVGAILPQFVPQEKLTRINGINATIQSVIMFVSPVLSGLLLSLAPIQAIFYIDVITAILAIGVLSLFLKIPPHAGENQTTKSSYWKDMKKGLVYIRQHRFLMAFFSYLGLFMVLITPAAFLTPLQVARTYGPEVWRLTAIEMVFSVGMMAGGALISAWGGFKNRIKTILLSNIIMAVCTVALGIVPNFIPYLVFMGIFGIGMPLFNTPSAVLLQEHVENEYLGRVFSVMTMLSTSLMPISMLLFGPLAEFVRIEILLIVSGLSLLAISLFAIFSRRLHEADKSPAVS